MKQRARELGAISTGLVRAGEVFDWPTLEPWADALSEEEEKAESAAEEAKTQADASMPHEAPGGVRHVPGKSEPSRGPGRRRNNVAET